MTQKEIITKIKSLKEVKPEKEWVLLTKNNVLGKEANIVRPIHNHHERNSLFELVSSLVNPRIAFSFVAFLFVVVGITGLSGLVGFRPSSDTAALLVAQDAVKNDVELLRVKSQILSEIAAKGDEKENIALVAKEVEEIAKDLTDKVKKEPRLARNVALDISKNRTYLEVMGSEIVGVDLKETSGVLYKTIVEEIMRDVERANLSEIQQERLSGVKKMYDSGEYAKALESILLINATEREDENGGASDDVIEKNGGVIDSKEIDSHKNHESTEKERNGKEVILE